MTKENFSKILKEYDFSDNQIDIIWNTRPNDDLDEEILRKAAIDIAPIKDKLVQA